MKKTLSLFAGDYKNITRDTTLLLVFFAPILLTLVPKLLVMILSDLLHREFDLNLKEYYPLITFFFLMLFPMMFGMISAFIIVDERDENVISSFMVTPLGLKGYFIYRVSSATLFSFVYFFIFIFVTGFTEVRFLSFMPIAFLLALEAPLLALLTVSLASNKIEALAVAKGAGITVLAPFLSFFVDSPLRYAAFFLPHFWISEAFFASFSSYYYIALSLAFITHFFWLFFLAKRFLKSFK